MYILIISAILLSACSTNMNNYPAISCKTEDGVDPCQEGFTCYDSQSWPKGGVQGPQEGDLLCHKNCETNSDCPENMPNCETVFLSRGDIQIEKKFCTN